MMLPMNHEDTSHFIFAPMKPFNRAGNKAAEPPAPTSSQTEEQREAGVTKLLIAIDRLRSERSDAQHELEYLQMESSVEKTYFQTQLAEMATRVQQLEEDVKQRDASIRVGEEARKSQLERKDRIIQALKARNSRLERGLVATCIVAQNCASSPFN